MIQNNRADFQQKFSRYAEKHKYIYCIHTYKYTYIPINLKKVKEITKIQCRYGSDFGSIRQGT